MDTFSLCFFVPFLEPVLTDFDIIDGHCLVPDRQPVAMPTSLSYIGHGTLPRSEELTDYLQHGMYILHIASVLSCNIT